MASPWWERQTRSFARGQTLGSKTKHGRGMEMPQCNHTVLFSLVFYLTLTNNSYPVGFIYVPDLVALGFINILPLIL